MRSFHDFLNISDQESELPQPEIEPPVPQQSNDPRITFVKSEATKRYLSASWESMFSEKKERDERTHSFKEHLKKSKVSSRTKKKMKRQFSSTETTLTRMKRQRLSVKYFPKIKLIGRGSFGEIWLVQSNLSLDKDQYYAMKCINKLNILISEQAESATSERILLSSIDNPWVVKLHYSFQDPEMLYLVLEFAQGGDLFSLLRRRTYFTEDIARFYLAEIAIAIDSVHRLGFVHRDIKPDNILLTTSGHVKLADFGLSTRFEKRDVSFLNVLEQIRNILVGTDSSDDYHTNSSEKPNNMVGTLDYMAPEVIVEDEYDSRCDWWSLGIIAYEMLYGLTPFESPSPTETALKIVRFSKNISFPAVPKVSDNAIDLLKRLICKQEDRLTYSGIVSHPFFEGFDWDHILDQNGPITLPVTCATDLSWFEEPQDVPSQELSSTSSCICENQSDLMKYAFLGFTFKKKKAVQSLDESIFLPPPDLKNK